MPIYHTCLRYSLLALSVLGLAPARGDDEISAAIEGEQALFANIPSVYSASKYEQPVTKAPASISIVTADEIKKYGYRTFGAILASLRGFYHTNDRNYGFVGVRGFGLPSDYNSRLLLLIDGHRYNDNIFDSFYTDEGFPVDVDVIERIEVVRGPSSSLYGASAFFGVINVITKRGRDQQGANVAASYGSNDTYKTSVSYGDRFSNGLETFLTGTFYDSQGYNRLYYREFDDPSSNNGVALHNDEEQAKKLMAKAAFGDLSLQGLYVRRKKDIPTASFGTLFNNPAENTVDQATFVELKYDHTFANQLNLQSRLSYNNYRYRGDYPYDYSATATPFIVINKDLAYGQWWRAELEATQVLWKDHRITVGGQYQDNFHQYQTNYDLQTYVDSNANTYQWALFFQDDYSIARKLTLNAGVRFDYFSIFGESVNPRVGLIYNPWDGTVVKLLYGTAFRAPNQYELNYIGPTYISNSHLQPETLETVELIVEHYFNQQLRAELNIFHTDISDLIVLTTADGHFLQNQNVGDVSSYGAEVQLEANWANGFQGRVSYSWVNTENKKNHERLPNSPEHLVKLNLIAPLWSDKVFAGFETQYVSSRKTSLGGSVDGYVISNLTLFTQNWVKGLELSAGVYNLFDERYFDPGSDVHIQNGIEQDGLTFRFKLNYEF
jgi:iron complex outermembrane receptor protein